MKELKNELLVNAVIDRIKQGIEDRHEHNTPALFFNNTWNSYIYEEGRNDIFSISTTKKTILITKDNLIINLDKSFLYYIEEVIEKDIILKEINVLEEQIQENKERLERLKTMIEHDEDDQEIPY